MKNERGEMRKERGKRKKVMSISSLTPSPLRGTPPKWDSGGELSMSSPNIGLLKIKQKKKLCQNIEF